MTARGGRPAAPHWLRRWSADERGAAIVEFAIVVPVLLVLVMGIIDFGRMLAVAASLAAAVRDGARQGAAASDVDAQRSAIQTRVVNSFQRFGGATLAASSVTVTLDVNQQIVTVSVANYPYQTITPIAALIGMRAVTLSRSANFRWERAL